MQNLLRTLRSMMAFQPAHQTSRLLLLPPELRELIYSFATDSLPTLETTMYSSAVKYDFIPTLAQTCQQLRHEVLALLFRTQTLHMHLDTSIRVRQTTTWLCQLKECGAHFQHVVVHCTNAPASAHGPWYYDQRGAPLRTSIEQCYQRRRVVRSLIAHWQVEVQALGAELRVTAVMDRERTAWKQGEDALLEEMCAVARFALGSTGAESTRRLLSAGDTRRVVVALLKAAEAHQARAEAELEQERRRNPLPVTVKTWDRHGRRVYWRGWEC